MKMKLGMLLLALSLFGGSKPARADAKCEKDCKPVRREVCFNLLCSYEKDRDEKDHGSKFASCQAAAQFTKFVTGDGREVEDKSTQGDAPRFEVECDDEVLFNGSARRFTDEQGTRIQSEGGPYPAILLPRDALEDTHRYLLSSLELGGEKLRGFCYAWTGQQ